ncbi:hypothetical protein FOA52_008629 [Chlamydomonas sp. UWO 241]|nr:hypothetical protein FOA52_008629 [Chlamydomonas sp. UWO 241]
MKIKSLTEAQCVDASKTSGKFYKKLVTQMLISDKRRLIGPKGKLEAQVPGGFFHLCDTTDALTGYRYNVLVYADSKEQLARAVKLTYVYC